MSWPVVIEPPIVGVSLLAVKPGMIGGLATYVRQVARALADRGRERFVFFAPVALKAHWAALLPRGARIQPVALDNRLQIKRSLYEILGLPRRARQMGCEVLFYPNVASPIVTDPRPLVALFDVMHLSQPHETLWHKQTYLRLCYSTLARSDTRVVTISEFSRRDIAARTPISPEQVSVVYCGVDERFFNKEPSAFRVPERVEGPYLLSVGASYPHKRLSTVVGAFERVAADWARLGLVMVGTDHGSARGLQRLLGRIAESPFRDRITRLERLDWGRLPGLYWGASAVVHASLYEGFGFPIAEAMASGVPVAAVPAEAVVELLDGHGVVAEGFGEENLARAIREVLDWSMEERLACTSAASARAARLFRWCVAAEGLDREFCLLADRGRRRVASPGPGD